MGREFGGMHVRRAASGRVENDKDHGKGTHPMLQSSKEGVVEVWLR